MATESAPPPSSLGWKKQPPLHTVGLFTWTESMGWFMSISPRTCCKINHISHFNAGNTAHELGVHCAHVRVLSSLRKDPGSVWGVGTWTAVPICSPGPSGSCSPSPGLALCEVLLRFWFCLHLPVLETSVMMRTLTASPKHAFESWTPS